jgi:hypothetical protein
MLTGFRVTGWSILLRLAPRLPLISRWQSEIECRSRLGLRLQPYSAAMPLDGLLTERESKSVPGVFLSVKTRKSREYTTLECRVYARTIVLHGEHPVAIRPSR